MQSLSGKIRKTVTLFSSHCTVFFALVALVFGVIVVFTLPPLFGNDEIVHFPRAYQISEGTPWEKQLTEHDFGGPMPLQIKQFNDDYREMVQSQTLDRVHLRALIDKYSREKLVETYRTDLVFTSAGVYSPWSYAPSALGVKLAHAFNLPLNWYVWLGRLLALLAWIGMTVWAIRLLPAGKLFMVAIALLPTALVQAATMGMDGVVNGLSWVIIAMTFAIFAGKVRLTWSRALLLGGMCFFLATTKQGYMPIALLPLIIPAKLYRFDKKVVNGGRVAFGVSLITAAVYYVSRTLPLTSVLHFTQRPGVNVDSHAQILHIIEHPFMVLYLVFIQPFTTYAGGIWAGTVGVITNKTLYLPAVIIGLLYLTLIIAFVSGGHVYRFAGQYARRVGMGSLVVGLATFTLVSLALYTAFTTVAHPYIEGLQGRYFLPFAPLAIGVMNLWPAKWRWPVSHWLYALTTVGVLAGLVSTLFTIAQLL